MIQFDSPSQKLGQILVRILSSRFDLSAKELQDLASTKKQKFSTAAIYKELGNLIQSGVAVKNRGGYSLSLGWVLHMLGYAESLHATYFRGSYLKTLIPTVGNKQSWKFQNMLRANDFWNQLILALVKNSKTQTIF